MKKLLIYSDCYIYGGSERLMSSIIRSPELNAEYEILMAYRTHKLYNDGLATEYAASERKNFIPLHILSHATLFYRLKVMGLPLYVRIIVMLFCFSIERIGIYWLWNVVQFYLLLRRYKPDVLHINNGGYPGARSCTHLALVASFLHPARVVYQVNNMAFPPTDWFDRVVDRRLSRYCQFVTASKYAQSRLMSVRGFPSSALTQVYNTAPSELISRTRAELLQEWTLPENTIILSQVAFLSVRKGQHCLLGALRLLKARKPELLHNLILFLVGDGEQQMPLKQLCQQYGLEANVRFTGYRKDSIEFVAHCDIFLLPSIANEDMPLVVLSAMEHGKTIIASRLGGIEEEIEDGVSGILIKPDLSTCEAALADAIQGQLLNPNTLLGKHARERYNLLFSASAYAQTLKLLYTRLNMKDTAI